MYNSKIPLCISYNNNNNNNNNDDNDNNKTQHKASYLNL